MNVTPMRERSPEEVARFVTDLAAVHADIAHLTTCYIYGMGGHPASTYRRLRTTPVCEVLWHKRTVWWPLAWIPSQAGIVRVRDSRSMPSLFESICELSMAGIYLVSAANEARTSGAARAGWRALERLVDHDPSRFVYVVGMDATDEAYMERVELGEQCPARLRALVTDPS